MIGSAAARHLAKAGHDVILIGPDEVNTDYARHKGNFGSHYDEGRITRKNDYRAFYAQVSTASINRYPEIAAESGIEFFTEAGALIAGSPDYMADVAQHRDSVDVDCIELDAAGIVETFPYFDFPDDYTASYEPKDAGYISPRNLVAAQSKAARSHGATIIDEEVLSIQDGLVKTANHTIEADQVIVAAGGWTDDLLGRQTLTVYARTVAFHEVGPEEVRRLAKMPSLVLDSMDGLYVLPPIRYPDGKVWLKLGGDPVDVALPDKTAINDWFRSGGSAEVGTYLTDRICEIMPGLAFESRFHLPCVTTWSDNGIPEIRRLSDRLIIAAAGNGAGAKCSDELGRMAAAIAVETIGELV